MNNAQAAELLGMAENEVVAVADSAAGPVIRTFDGQTYIIADKPDANGKTGVMFMVPPVPNYQGGFPVYAKPAAPTSEQALADLKDQIEATLGVDLPDPAPRAGQLDPRDPGPDANLNEAEVVETAEALVTDPGPGAPEHLVASGPNPDNGAQNLADPADPTDTGTVVPEGSAHQVMAWVGEDPARARQALDFERSKDAPRARLVNSLATLAGEPARAQD